MKLGKLWVLAPLLLLLAAEAAHDWPELSIARENARLEMLGAAANEPGDAAAAYAPFLAADSSLLKNEKWEKLSSVNILEPTDETEKKVIAEALEAARAELDALARASRRKDFQLWGAVVHLDKSKDIMSQPIPSYFNLISAAKLLAVRSRDLDAAGDEAGARENLLSALRMGHHLSSDPMLIGYMVSIAIKSLAAQEMAALHGRHGRKGEADAWRLYSDLLETRKKAWKKFAAFDAKSSPEEVTKLILEEDIPFALRFEVLCWRHYCVSGGDLSLGTLKCVITNTPDWVLAVEDELAKRDPLYQMFIAVLKAKTPRDLAREADPEFIGVIGTP